MGLKRGRVEGKKSYTGDNKVFFFFLSNRANIRYLGQKLQATLSIVLKVVSCFTLMGSWKMVGLVAWRSGLCWPEQ